MSPTDVLLKNPPPQSLESEQCVLGSMLIETDAIIRASGILKPEDFYRDAHRVIFETLCEMHERREAVDLITVSEALRTRGMLDEIGGLAYLTTLANFVPTAANIEGYAAPVRQKAIARRGLNELQRSMTRILEGTEPADKLVAEAADRLTQLATSSAPARHEVHIKDILPERLDAYETAYKNKGQITGWPTGLPTLDKQTGGFQPSDLVIDAGRPSAGKTAYALFTASEGMKQTKKTALFFSLEMRKEQLVDRLVSSESGIEAAQLRNGFINDGHWSAIGGAAGRLGGLPLLIDDDPTHTTDSIWATSRRVALRYPVGLIVVDYLQLVNDRSDDTDDNARFTRISRRLKAMARDLNVPVLALSQLNRGNERGFSKPRPPRLSDLRGSGAIEQDADVVFFLWCDEDEQQSESPVKTVQLILAKQRNGPTGDYQLRFDRPRMRFSEIDERHSTPPPEPRRRNGD